MTAPAVGEALPVAVPLVGGPVVVRGAVRVEETADGILPRRFGEHASRRIVDDFMRAAMTQSAGVRLAFRTAARTLQLTVHATKLTDSVDAPIPAAVYDLCAEGRVMATARSAVGSRFLFSFETAISGRLEGPADTLVFSLDGVDREYELWLPYTDEVEVREPVDSVVLVTGGKAEDSLYYGLKEAGVEVRAVGDCVSPRRVFNAIWEAELAAREI